MSRRIVYLDRTLASLPLGIQQAWHEWLRRHGVDAQRIPLDSDLELDDDARTITHAELITEGGRTLDPNRHRAIVVHQLEAPALPTPPGFLVFVEGELAGDEAMRTDYADTPTPLASGADTRARETVHPEELGPIGTDRAGSSDHPDTGPIGAPPRPVELVTTEDRTT